MERSRDSCNPFDRKINRASNLPLNNWRNDAWVPVVPFTPRNFRSSLARRRALSSIRRSWSHNVARFPTVVSCAGWRWVYPNVGNSRYIIANLARRDKTLANFGRRISNPWRRTIKSLIIKMDKVYRRVFRRYFFFHIYILPCCHQRSNLSPPDGLWEPLSGIGSRKRGRGPSRRVWWPFLPSQLPRSRYRSRGPPFPRFVQR